MTKRILNACMIMALTIIPALSYGQNNKTNTPRKDKKSVINVNKLDVIYQDDEYTGIVIDQKAPRPEDANIIYEPPMLLAPPAMSEADNELPSLYQRVEDEGVESEEDILRASHDTTNVHLKRLDVSHWKDTACLQLITRNHKFAFPTPERAIVTSHFGARRRRWHYGVDLAMPTGEPIYSAFDGVVRFSNYNNGGYGNLIVVSHDNGLETYYAHLSKRKVHAGERVKAGQVIGLCGNTGRSYGSHLHFEVRYRGVAMNPENVIDCYKRNLIDDQLVLTARSFAKVSRSNTGKVPDKTNRSGAKYYKVRSGDTLGKIAARNGTTIKKLCKLNGIKETSILSIGHRIRVR